MPQPNNRKNDEHAAMERRKKVAALYVQGKTQWDIARRLGCGQGTVSKDLAAIREEWKARSVRDFESRLAEELARLDALEAEAWAGWARSRRDAETVHRQTDSVRQSPTNDKGKPTPPRGKPAPPAQNLVPIRETVRKTTKGQAGDPRFLERVAWCVETRLKLMGLLRGPATVVNQPIIDWSVIMGGVPLDQPVPDAIEAQIVEALEHRDVKSGRPTTEVDDDEDAG